MRALIRYAVPSLVTTVGASVLLIAVATMTPSAWSWRDFRAALAFVIQSWEVLCIAWGFIMLICAVSTRDGRSSLRLWLSASAIMAKGIGIVVLLWDGLNAFGSRTVDGRPLRAAGKVHRAGVTEGDDWSARSPRPLLEGDAGAADWERMARDEHASVATFSRLSLELLAVGAPPSLVQRTHQAALEEISHARVCFEAASTQRGTPLTAAAFPEALMPLAPEETRAQRLARLAQESLRDGLVGEGAAARAVESLASRVATPWLASALHQIATEEETHAELGRDIAEWCLAQRGWEPVRSAEVRA
jgi:hypothetical protein